MNRTDPLEWEKNRSKRYLASRQGLPRHILLLKNSPSVRNALYAAVHKANRLVHLRSRNGNRRKDLSVVKWQLNECLQSIISFACNGVLEGEMRIRATPTPSNDVAGGSFVLTFCREVPPHMMLHFALNGGISLTIAELSKQRRVKWSASLSLVGSAAHWRKEILAMLSPEGEGRGFSA